MLCGATAANGNDDVLFRACARPPPSSCAYTAIGSGNATFGYAQAIVSSSSRFTSSRNSPAAIDATIIQGALNTE